MARLEDFVDVIHPRVVNTMPVQSLMDADFYKFPMGQFIFKHYSGVEVTFKIIVRDKRIKLTRYIKEAELREALDYTMGLRFQGTDIQWLRGMDLYDKYMFKEPYLDFLRTFKLTSYELVWHEDYFELSFTGPWAQVTHWETIALAIISTLYYRGVLKQQPREVVKEIYRRAQAKIYDKLYKLKKYPRLKFADFGQRRRHSFLWQKWVVAVCKEVLGDQFTGTSNTWMAFHESITAIGTNAHELPMVLTALANNAEEMRHAQYLVPELWQGMYGQGLRIFLPDTYGSAQFFAHAPKFLLTWRGQRQDSGVPIDEGERYCAWLRENGVDPSQKLSLFSDGLDVDPMIQIHTHFDGWHNNGYGWGTMLDNDFEDLLPEIPDLRPFSIVCKIVSANGRPCVKLSNNTDKATGTPEAVEYYKTVFGVDGRSSQKVLV